MPEAMKVRIRLSVGIVWRPLLQSRVPRIKCSRCQFETANRTYEERKYV